MSRDEKLIAVELTDSILLKLQSVLLELLCEFDRICRKHDILYSIDGGTLLGAVRHGGFIPWDDDADVIMNRPAYEKFLQIIDTELDNSKFYFQDINRTPKYRWGYAKLRRKDSIFLRSGQEHINYEQGIFLDIFVCDNVPQAYIPRCVCNFNSFLFRKAFYSEVGIKNSSGISKVIYEILARIPEEKLKKTYNNYIIHRNKRDSRWVKCLTFPAKNRTYGYKRNWYEDVIDMEFQGHIFKASRDYDEYLSFMYGNYMEIPKIEDRVVHPASVLKFPDEEAIQGE